MRTFLRKFGLFFLLFFSAMLVACNGNATTGTAIVGIAVSADELPDRLAVGDFQLSDLSITVMNSDGSSITLAASSAMVSTADLAKLATPGIHTITITYQGFTDTVQITLVDNGLTLRMMAIYDLGVSSGAIAVTYEEWLESVRGEDGVPGTDGREVALRVEAGIIQWHYVDSETWTDLIAVSALTGTPGREVTFRISSGNLQWQYVGETTWKTLLSLQEISGTDGITPTISISPEGFWVINGTVTDFRAVPLTPEIVTVDMLFELNGGTLAESVASEYLDIPKGEAVTLPIPEKHGYVFAGWFTGNTANDGQFLNTSPAVKDLTLHARWQADVRPIETLLSTLISGTNYVADFTMVEQAEGMPDYREDRRMTTAVDELGQIHRTRTVVRMNGSEISQSTFRSSVIIGDYEYFYQVDRLDDTEMAGRTYPDSLKNKIDWDAPRVDSVYQWFRIDDFRLRDDEYVFDYIASDDGLRAYASYLIGSAIDYENLTAVFNGDTGVLEITIPLMDDDLADLTVTQAIRIVETGTVTDRFLFEDFRTVLIDTLQSLASTRIEQTLPTAPTETAFLDLFATLSEPLPAITDPVTLWDDVISARDQLVEFPLVSDPRRVAVGFAKQDLLVRFNALSLTATEDSIALMEALLDVQFTELEGTTSIDQVAPLLATFLSALEAVYEPDSMKIDYQNAKDRVTGYLDATQTFLLSILDSVPPAFYAAFADAYAAIEAAATSKGIDSAWDGFVAALQNLGLTFRPDYEDEIAAQTNLLISRYLDRTQTLWAEDVSWSMEFDAMIRPRIESLKNATVYEFMAEYLFLEGEMDALYHSLWMEISSERIIEYNELMGWFADPTQQNIYLETLVPLFASLNDLTTGEGVKSAWEEIESAFLQLEMDGLQYGVPFLGMTKYLHFQRMEDQIRTIFQGTASAESLAEMNVILGNYRTYLSEEIFYDLESVYFRDSDFIAEMEAAYEFDSAALQLETVRAEVVDRLEKLLTIFDINVYHYDLAGLLEIEDAIHQVMVAADPAAIAAIETALLADFQTRQILLNPEAAQVMAILLGDAFERLEAAHIEPSASLASEYAAFLEGLPNGLSFVDEALDFLQLYREVNDFYWNVKRNGISTQIDTWYEEEIAIVEIGYQDSITLAYQRCGIFYALVRDPHLMQIYQNNFQDLLMDCPTDPVRHERYETAQLLKEDIDGYAAVVTSDSLAAMRALYDELVGLLEGETATPGMQNLLSVYRVKIADVYVEDPQKAAFQLLKERYFILFDQLGEVYTVSVPFSDDEVFIQFENRFLETVEALDRMEFRPDAQAVLDGAFDELWNLYLQCRGDELLARDHLMKEVEYYFHDRVTGGDFYLEDKTLEMDELRYLARGDVFSAGLPDGLAVYADYVMAMKSLRFESLRTFQLAQIQKEHDAMMSRLPDADRPVFDSAYLEIRTLMETAQLETGFEILYNRFQSLLWEQTPDPLLDAQHDGIETIQRVLEIQFWTATDDSRIQMGDAQTAAIQAITSATTVDDANAAYTNGRATLEAAYVEDPVRAALYNTQMADAETLLRQKEQIILSYGDNIYQVNQAIVIIYIHKIAVWNAGSLAEVTTALNDATAALESLGLIWNSALVDELKGDCLHEMMVLRSLLDPIPSEVENAYLESTGLISGSADPLMIQAVFDDFVALILPYLQ